MTIAVDLGRRATKPTNQIEESCYDIRFKVFIFFYLTGVTLCNKRLSYVSLPSYLVVRNAITIILDTHESFFSTQHFCYF